MGLHIGIGPSCMGFAIGALEAAVIPNAAPNTTIHKPRMSFAFIFDLRAAVAAYRGPDSMRKLR